MSSPNSAVQLVVPAALAIEVERPPDAAGPAIPVVAIDNVIAGAAIDGIRSVIATQCVTETGTGEPFDGKERVKPLPGVLSNGPQGKISCDGIHSAREAGKVDHGLGEPGMHDKFRSAIVKISSEAADKDVDTAPAEHQISAISTIQNVMATGAGKTVVAAISDNGIGCMITC